MTTLNQPDAPRPEHGSWGVALWDSLNTAAASIQRSARSQAEVFRAFREQISGLGLRGGLTLLDHTRQRVVVHAIAQPAAVQKMLAGLEQLVGIKSEGFSFPVAEVDAYRQVIERGAAVFVPDSSAVVAQQIPRAARPFARQILKAFGSPPGLFAPLVIDGQVQGILNVAGANLRAEDASAMQAFANHIAIALDNARLFAALQESEARFRTVVTSAPVILFTLNPDGIFTLSEGRGLDALDLAPGQVVGLSVFELYRDEPQILEVVRRALAGESVRTVIHTRGLTFDTWYDPVRNRAGQVTGVTGVAVDITERTRAEAAMHASQVLLQQTFASLDQAVFVVNPANRQIIDCNPSAERIFGYAREEMIGRNTEFLHVDRESYEAFGLRLIRALEQSGVFRTEFQMKRRDATLFHTENTVTEIRDKSGRRTAVVSVVRDVTERKQAEVALREREAQYRALFEKTPIGLGIADSQGALLAFNDAMLQPGGYTREDLRDIGNVAALYADPGARERVLALARAQGFVHQHEVRFKRKDGSSYDALLSLTPIMLNDRPCWQALVEDTTARKRTEAELVRLRKAVEASGEVIFLTDRDGLITWINPEFTRVYGYAADEVVDRCTPRILKSGVMRPEGYERLWATILAGQVVRGELTNRTKDGRLLTVEGSVNPILDEQETIVGFLAIQRDVSERKRAEEEIRRRADEFAVLYETARALSAQQDLAALLETIAERARALLGTAGGGIYLYDAARGDLVMTLARGTSAPVGTRLQLGEGMAGRVAQTRQPLIVDDYRQWPDRSPSFDQIPFSAVVEVPMLYGGELVGVLVVHEVGPSERRFTEADARLLTLFAAQAAAAVHDARLLEQIQRRLEELEAVNRISTALRTAQTLDAMLPRLLDETLATVGTDAGILWLHDPAAGVLRQSVVRGWFAQIAEAPIHPDEGIAGHVFATGKPYRSREFVSDPRARASTREQIPPGWGGACVPIHTAHEIVGVLFASVALPRELKEAEVNLLTTVAEIAGNAIHRMRLHGQTTERLERIAALHTIDMAIGASLDLRLTLNVLLEQVLHHLKVDAAAVLLFRPQAQMLEYVAGRGFQHRTIEGGQLRLGEPHAGRAALERRTVSWAAPAGPDHSPGFSSLMADEGFVAYLGVPLTAKGQIKGVLEVFGRAPLHDDSEWQEFLETLAGQAAIAIDNIQLFEGLQRSNIELGLAYDTTLEGWARALELRDAETQGHTQRVTEMVVQLARGMGLSSEELTHLRRGTVLHDIGKMGIPDTILFKPGPLTEAEWAIMRQHPIHAHGLLAPIPFLRPALDIPHCHHEKWDGSGYPRGLRGEQIPLAARIFAVVDVWDALRSDRPYRAAWPEAQVHAYLREQAGKHFDPQIVAAFMPLIEAAPE